MARKRRANRGPNGPKLQPVKTGAGNRELIVITQDQVASVDLPKALAAKSRRGGRAGAPASAEAIKVIPLFGSNAPQARARSQRKRDLPDLPDFGCYYHVEAADERLDDLAESFRELDEVAGAYVKPKGEPPRATIAEERPPLPDAPPSTTPDFSARQIYRDRAPAGIDVPYAWQFRGGRGEDVRIIDCEWGWRFTHEDLLHNPGGVVIGTGSSFEDHGTAVVGVLSADENSFGVTGIVPNAIVNAASFQTLPTATVIRQAADRLQFGDIILLEIHRPGPGASGIAQDGFIAIEWWPDDFAAIRYAVMQGIIVVEAAGNGARNLDAPIYDQPLIGFPSTWRNPFNPANPSSEAVLVGAGAPPPGTHGANWGPDRSRLDFSNHGRRVDVQGWGREVTTTGYGDLQGGPNDQDRWYTDIFSGTSSASPIVVGALGCVQGILRARNRPALTASDAIRLLRTTGSPQQTGPTAPLSERIGNRPDLRQLLPAALGGPPDAIERLERADSLLTVDCEGGSVTINIRSPRIKINVTGD